MLQKSDKMCGSDKENKEQQKELKNQPNKENPAAPIDKLVLFSFEINFSFNNIYSS